VALDPPGDGVQAAQGVALVSLETDGTFLPVESSGQPFIEWVGDSMMGDAVRRASLSGEAKPPCIGVEDDWSSTSNAQTCAALGARCSTVAVGGHGVYHNCCTEGDKRLPDFFLQTCAADAVGDYFSTPRAAPDAVVINLGTNDYYWARHHGLVDDAAYAANFTRTLVGFMANITRYYDQADIPFLCAAGPMADGESALNATAQAVLDAMALGINAHFVDLSGATLDGCLWHPGLAGHHQMASKLIPAVRDLLPAHFRRAPLSAAAQISSGVVYVDSD